jgi:hypothetical protein
MAFSPLPIVDFNRNSLDVSPFTDALNTARKEQFQRNALASQERQQDRQFGLQQAQDARAAERHPIELKAANQQLAHAMAAEGRQAAMHPYQIDQMKATAAAAKDERESKIAMSAAKIADLWMADPDPVSQQAKFEKYRATPKIAAAMAEAKLPPEMDNPRGWHAYFTAIATPFRDKLTTRSIEAKAGEDEASARHKDALTAAAGNKGVGFDNLKDVLKYEQDLREEFTKQPAVKEYGVVRDAYGKIKSVANDGTAAGDMSLVFAYMKMLDPNSTVRETEYANAQNTTGVAGQMYNIWNKVKDGAFLNPTQRNEFLAQAHKLYGVHEGQYGALRGQYGALAKRAGIDPSRITLDFGRVDGDQRNPYGTGPERPQVAPERGAVPRFDAPPRAQQGPTGGPARVNNDAEYQSLPPKTEFIGPDGQLRVKP